MNKKILIAALFIAILIIVIIALAVNYFLRQPISIINKIGQPAKVEEKNFVEVLNSQRANISQIQKQNIEYNTYYQMLEFQTFCNVKNSEIDYYNECNSVFNLYLYDPTPDREATINKWCKWDSYFSLIYFLKQNQKDKFMAVCNDYKVSDLLINNNTPAVSCDQAWAKNLKANEANCNNTTELCWYKFEAAKVEEIKTGFMAFCEKNRTTKTLSAAEAAADNCELAWESKLDENAARCDTEANELCWPILEGDGAKIMEDNFSHYEGKTDLAACQQTNAINFSQTDPLTLKNSACKKEDLLRKAKNSDDCQKIDDTFAKLICLSEFNNNICAEMGDSLKNAKLPDFIQKYSLKNCCFQGNKEGRSSYTKDLQ